MDSQTPAPTQEELIEIAKGLDWRLTPATMAHYLTKDLHKSVRWIPAKHLLYTSSLIAQTIAQGNGRLIVSFPPRHGKSRLISIGTPVWFLDKWPYKHVILTSYGAELATDFGRAARDFAQAREEILNFKVRSDLSRVNQWETTRGGGMFAVGIGGPITGRGADLLLVDDYLKNIKDASSETIRQDNYEWFLTTALTRLEPGGTAIIIATRWNIDDLIGRLRKDTGDEWTEIKLSAFAAKDDPLGRPVGEPLWPERYDEHALEAIKTNMGTFFFEALYQQEPMSRAAGLIDKIPIIDIQPHYKKLRFTRAWDFGGTLDAGDYTCGALLAEDLELEITYILDIKREQFSPAGVEKLVKDTAIEDGIGTTIVLEQEPGAAGKSFVDYYQRRILKGFTVLASRPSGDKFIRANPLLASMQAGHVSMLRARWNRMLVDEFASFPDGLNDDQVDACATAYNQMYSGIQGGLTWGRKKTATAPADVPAITGRTDSLVQGVVFGR